MRRGYVRGLQRYEFRRNDEFFPTIDDAAGRHPLGHARPLQDWIRAKNSSTAAAAAAATANRLSVCVLYTTAAAVTYWETAAPPRPPPLSTDDLSPHPPAHTNTYKIYTRIFIFLIESTVVLFSSFSQSNSYSLSLSNFSLLLSSHHHHNYYLRCEHVFRQKKTAAPSTIIHAYRIQIIRRYILYSIYDRTHQIFQTMIPP